MTGIRSTIVAMLLATGAMVATSSGAFAWVAIAKNANGATWKAVGPDKDRVAARAITKCETGSRLKFKGTCKLITLAP